MNNRVDQLISGLTLNPPLTSIKLVKEIELKLEIIFPAEYVEFMKAHNGAEGRVGENSYLVLWTLEELISLNEAYEANTFVPGLLLFGSDGGGVAFAFDKRDDKLPIVEVPFIGMNVAQAKMRGQTFYEFLEYMYRLP